MENVILLTIDSELKSASKLGFKTQTYFSDFKENYDNHVIVRWGYGYDVAAKDLIFCDSKDFKNVLNPLESIKLNVRKNEAIQVLSKVVKTPKIYLDKVPKNKLVVYRPTSHAAGKDFQLKKGPFQIPNGFYATEFIKTDKEVRVFVCGNKTLTCSREKAKKSDSDICRSNYRYARIRKTPIRLHRMALKAAKALNLHLCGFDILVKNRNYYFLEGNSSVTIETPQVRKFYQTGIKSLINKKFPKLPKLVAKKEQFVQK
jgi:predicted ATP-grasp superfamily ATP-dependent carboligase